MAEGSWLRSKLLAGLDDQRLEVADFHRILFMARRHRGANDTNGECSAPDPSVLARQMALDLSCFRRLAKLVGFPPLLVELALIDDESLERSRHPKEGHVSEWSDYTAALQPDETPQSDEHPEFVSVLAAYDEFAEDDRLLRAWHRATSRVVKEEGWSIVGTPESYQYVYLWDQVPKGVTQSRSTPPQQKPSNFVERSDFVSTNPGDREAMARIGLPVFYFFGKVTTSDLIEDRHRPVDRPPRIARQLLAHLLDSTVEEFGDLEAQFLDGALLMIIPFTRPRFYGSPGLDPEHPQATQRSTRRGDRPGGAVFLLCSIEEARDDYSQSLIPDQETELDRRVRRFAIAIWWLLFQSAMLEARQERDDTREADLAQYSHLIAKSLRQVTTHVANAISDAEGVSGIPTSVIDELNHAEVESKRLAAVGEIARAALLIKSGRAATQELSLAATTTQFETIFYGLTSEVLNFVKSHGIQSAARRAQVRDINFVREPKSRLGTGTVRSNESYLRSLIGELVKNAVEYGGYTDANGSTFSIILEDVRRDNSSGYVRLRIANPIRDDAAKKALVEMFRRRRLHLGLSHLELLAQVFSLPFPRFAVEQDDAVVYCAVGIIEYPKDGGA
jgi:hypothetical protein